MRGNWISTFDVGYAARQVAVVAFLALAPAVLWSAWRARRLLVLLVVPSFGLSVAWLLFVTLAASSRVWSFSKVPYVPLRVGPSDFTLRQLAWWLAASVWAPSLAAWLLRWWWRTRQPATQYSYRSKVPGLIAYMVAAILWTTLTMGIAEYDHEDTVVAQGFSLRKWEQLEPGMTRTEIHQLLGPPLQGLCRFGSIPECWVASYSAGHFAAVWFEGDRAVRIQRWYSD